MYQQGRFGVLCRIMPNAETMLRVYQRQLADSRGAGLTGVAELARLSRTIRALLDVINDDYDPRRRRSHWPTTRP
jgi:hypothetical protein